MRGKNQREQRQTRPQQDCHKGWQCSRLLDGHCDNRHSAEDIDNADSFNRLMKNNSKKQIIVVLDTYTKDVKPVSLMEPFLPIEFIKVGDTKLIPGEYYLGVFVQIYRGVAVISYEGILGQFGNWKNEVKIYEDFFPIEYTFKKPEEQRIYDGQIIVNDAYTKVLIGEKGRRYLLQPVNRPYKYPLLKGTKVRYFENRNNAQIVKLSYPRQIRLSGIIQIDKGSQFYFKSRNPEYDDMNPYFIPKDVNKYLEKWNYLFPYSIFKQEKLKENKMEEINKILNGFLLKGYFKDWPLNCIYPIIQLEDQVLQRNFKNMKNAIIFESGIQIRSFSKMQKIEAEKLVKNFKIQSHKKRQTLRKGIFTIDSKQTKCHDDAIYVRKLQNGSFQVQIHIADVAQMIKRKTKIDDEIRKRDETIYIKNYYQPMVPQALKNMLSLKENNDKLAFSLAFEVNPRGFIDFRTVQFFKSIVNVEQNLTHQQLGKNQTIFPDFFELSKVLDQARLVDSNYILQCQSKSQAAMTKLIFLSSIVPTFLLEENIKRSKELKTAIDSYLKQMITTKKLEMEKWEDKVVLINNLNRQASAIRKSIAEIENKIRKQIEKQRNRIMKELKDEQKQIKMAAKEKKNQEKKQKKQKKQKKRNQQAGERGEVSQSTESQQETQSQASQNQQIQGLQQDVSKKTLSQKGGIQVEQIDEQQEKKERQKRVKVMQDSRLKDFLSQSSVTQSQSEESEDQLGQDVEKFKMNKAVGGRKFLESIFSVFKIRIQWQDLKEINDAFSTILSKDKGQIYQHYFKRMQIMNRQHFKFIIRLAKQERRQLKRANQGKDQRVEKNDIGESSRVNDDRRNRYQNKQKLAERKVQNKPITKKVQEKIIKKEEEKEEGKREQKLQATQKKKKNQIKRQKKQFADQKVVRIETNSKLQPKAQEDLGTNLRNQQQPTYITTKIESQVAQEKKVNQRKQVNRRTKRNKNGEVRNQTRRRQKKPQPNNTQGIKKEYQLSLKDQQKKELMLIKLQSQKDRFIQKYSNSFLNYDKIDISEDQAVVDQAPQLIVILKNLKKSTVMKFLRQNKKQIKKNKKASEVKVKRQKIQNKQQIKEDQVAQSIQIGQIAKKTQNQAKVKSKKDKIKNPPNPKRQQKVDQKKQKLMTFSEEDREKNQKIKRLVQAQKERLIQKYKDCFLNNLNIQASDDQITQNQANPDLKAFLLDTKKHMILICIKKSIKAQSKQKNDKQQNQNTTRAKKKVETKIKQNKPVPSLKKVEQPNQIPPEIQRQQKVDQQFEISSENVLNKINIQVPQVVKLQQKLSEQKASQSLLKEKQLQKASKKVLSKKQLTKKINLLLQPFSEQIKSKYQQKKVEISSKVKQVQKQLKQNRESFKQQLHKAEKDYNLIRILSLGQESEEIETQKKSRKQRNKPKEKKSKHQKKNVYQNFLNNFQTYAKKASFKFKKMQEEQIDDFLESQFKVKELLTDDNIQESNRTASKLGTEQQKLLKWNNPIRSYQSLEVMRLIKTYRWLFQGKLHPTDVIRYSQDIKSVQNELKSLQKYREQKLEKGETDRKAKEANREIAKLQFYNLIKANEKAVHKFLTVTSPPSRPVKRVFHPILQEIEVKKSHNYDLFTQVKGIMKIVSEFPLQFQVELL